MGFHVLVLAGGSGTRLWPLSRGRTPKHLLPLAPGGQTLLRATVERVLGVGDTVHVVTAGSQAELCRDALQGLPLPEDAIIAEPEARGTGPALALAVAWLHRRDPGALIASVHADHRVDDAGAYRKAVYAAAGWALQSRGFATVGLRPTSAATGFGYVEIAERRDPSDWRLPVSPADDGAPGAVSVPAFVSDAQALPAYSALGFAEKPSATVAAQYLAGGRHLWNLGLFAWTATAFLEQLSVIDSALSGAIDDVVSLRENGDEGEASAIYAALTPVAVEPLLFERLGSALTIVEAAFGWSDLGSWADLRDAAPQDGAGNVVEGSATLTDSRGCTVVSRGGRLVALAGLEGLVVVDTPDAVLVIPASESQRVRDVVERLRAEGRTDLL